MPGFLKKLHTALDDDLTNDILLFYFDFCKAFDSPPTGIFELVGPNWSSRSPTGGNVRLSPKAKPVFANQQH